MKLHLPGKLNRALTALLCALLLTGCSRTDLAARPDLSTAAQADPAGEAKETAAESTLPEEAPQELPAEAEETVLPETAEAGQAE